MNRTLIRDVVPRECGWLDETITKGTKVFEYHGYTYGCISSTGVAVSLKDGEQPFFEVPSDSLGDVNEQMQTDNLVPENHWREVCKVGQGDDCCKYLAAGAEGMCCEKGTWIGRSIDKRTDMSAKSNNCSGAPQFLRIVDQPL